MVKRTQAEAEATRAALLDVALEVFARQGFEAATLDQIADAAGLTRGAIYHHFDGKAELLAAAIGERWRSAFEPIWRLLDGKGTERKRAVAFLLAFERALHDDPKVRTLLAVELRARPSSDGSRPAKSSALAAWTRRLTEFFAERDQDTAAAKGVALMALVNGLVSSALLMPRTRVHPELLSRLVGAIVGFQGQPGKEDLDVQK